MRCWSYGAVDIIDGRIDGNRTKETVPACRLAMTIGIECLLSRFHEEIEKKKHSPLMKAGFGIMPSKPTSAASNRDFAPNRSCLQTPGFRLRRKASKE
jgi:hypothetical protein